MKNTIDKIVKFKIQNYRLASPITLSQVRSVW